MKFFKDSWLYFYKNWWYLLILSLPVGVFAGALINPFKIIEFIGSYAYINVENFGSIFNKLFDFSWQGVLLFVLAFGAVCVCVSVALGFIENNMRSGKKDYKAFFKYINNNLLIVALNLAAFVLVLLLIKFLLSAILFLFAVIFTGLNSTPNIGTIIVSALLCVASLLLIMQIFTTFLINIPNMMINGFSFKNALYNSIKLANKTNHKLLIASIIPLPIVILLIVLTNGFWVVNLILAIVLFIYFAPLAMVAYFDVSDTTRYDNRKYYINY